MKPSAVWARVVASLMDRVSSYLFVPTRISCTHCHVEGFVCRGRVAAAGRSFMEFSCGSCQHTWRIAEIGERRKQPRPTPVRRR